MPKNEIFWTKMYSWAPLEGVCKKCPCEKNLPPKNAKVVIFSFCEKSRKPYVQSSVFIAILTFSGHL